MKQLSIFFNQLIRYKIETGQKTNKYNITTLLNTIGVPVNKRIKHTYLYNISLQIHCCVCVERNYFPVGMGKCNKKN
jgi:hypothetical protein